MLAFYSVKKDGAYPSLLRGEDIIYESSGKTMLADVLDGRCRSQYDGRIILTSRRLFFIPPPPSSVSLAIDLAVLAEPPAQDAVLRDISGSSAVVVSVTRLPATKLNTYFAAASMYAPTSLVAVLLSDKREYHRFSAIFKTRINSAASAQESKVRHKMSDVTSVQPLYEMVEAHKLSRETQSSVISSSFESLRDMQTNASLLQNIVKDLKLSLAQLVHHPGFTTSLLTATTRCRNMSDLGQLLEELYGSEHEAAQYASSGPANQAVSAVNKDLSIHDEMNSFFANYFDSNMQGKPGCILLTEGFCLFNRSRGLAPLMPKDFKSALDQLTSDPRHVCGCFSFPRSAGPLTAKSAGDMSGSEENHTLYIARKDTFMSQKLERSVLQHIVREGECGHMYGRLSSITAARCLGMDYAICADLLTSMRDREMLCVETISGVVFFYLNEFNPDAFRALL